MKLKKRKDTPELKEFWEYIEKTSKDVENNFPDWKKGGLATSKKELIYAPKKPSVLEEWLENKNN